MDHVGVIVDDLAGAIEFFAELGLEVQGRFSVDGTAVDRIVGLEGVRNDAQASLAGPHERPVA